ncbi:hypothetical protein Q3G72_025975 [Acer saccharum]|nr:hypothetical protein Q3G72_025975 [Acer saccharum]
MEALVVQSGLLFARDEGLLPCVVETDAQVVVKLIEFGSAPLSDVGIEEVSPCVALWLWLLWMITELA